MGNVAHDCRCDSARHCHGEDRGRGTSNSLHAELRRHESVGSLAVIYFTALLATELISNNAAAVLMMPFALHTANTLGVSHLPFTIAVMMAASMRFCHTDWISNTLNGIWTRRLSIPRLSQDRRATRHFDWRSDGAHYTLGVSVYEITPRPRANCGLQILVSQLRIEGVA